MDKIKRLSFLLGILLILIIVSFSNLNIIRYKIGEQFSQNIDSSKKVVVITGFVQELSKDFSKFFNPDKYLVITSENELEIKQFVETIKENYGNKSIDIFINSWWSSSNFNLGYKFDVNTNNSIKLIEQIIPLIKSGGKIVNISSDINNIEPSDHLLNNYLLVKSSIDKYFKIKSLEHYKDSIAFLTLKIDFAYDNNLTKSILPGINKSTDFIELKPSIEFIIGNNWASLSGREFYSSRINGKKLGYYLELEYPRLDDNSLNKQIITNVFNGENIIEPNIKDKELCVYSNNQNLLSAKLSQIYKIDHSYINFHHGIFTFLEKMISVFVPPKHQIISTLMNYLNTIGRDRTVISINPIIKNKYAVPNYNQILENINSLTRIIYLIAPLNKKDFDEFIKKIPFNIVIIIDFCYDGFVISNNNIKMQDYLTVPNTIITINTFSKFYGLPGIHLSWSIAKKDIGAIITNYFHYPINLYYEKVALQVLNDTQYLDSVKKYYDQERNKLIEILETNKINYWFEFPNTIIIEKTIGIKPGKFDDEYKITKFLAQTGLINYRVYMEGVVIKIRLFISKQEHNDELISKIVQISKFY